LLVNKKNRSLLTGTREKPAISLEAFDNLAWQIKTESGVFVHIDSGSERLIVLFALSLVLFFGVTAFIMGIVFLYELIFAIIHRSISLEDVLFFLFFIPVFLLTGLILIAFAWSGYLKFRLQIDPTFINERIKTGTLVSGVVYNTESLPDRKTRIEYRL
jgi:hypothetical protein